MATGAWIATTLALSSVIGLVSLVRWCDSQNRSIAVPLDTLGVAGSAIVLALTLFQLSNQFI